MVEVRDDQDAFRAEARSWLADNFPQSLAGKASDYLGAEGGAELTGDALTWMRRLGEKGWGTPTWPVEHGGGGLTARQAGVLQEEMHKASAFNPIPFRAGMGVTMVGPTILEYGTEDQKRRHLPPICRGEVRWCLGYSEPNAGSDLASLSTRAEDAGDHWVVNGQKTWTSGADISDWCGVLMRTDPTANKRDGISFLMLAMHQGGVATRPIRLIAGASPFCETFFTDARADKADLLGPLSDGWSVGKRLQQHERASQTGAMSPAGGGRGGSLVDMAKRRPGPGLGQRPCTGADVPGHARQRRRGRLCAGDLGRDGGDGLDGHSGPGGAGRLRPRLSDVRRGARGDRTTAHRGTAGRLRADRRQRAAARRQRPTAGCHGSWTAARS